MKKAAGQRPSANMSKENGDYMIGVTSGWYSIAKTPDLLGLAAKTASIATSGVNLVQVDFENTSEFFEPDAIERMRQVVDNLQINWGAHGEIGEFMAWESAIEVMWKQSHRRLHQYLDGFYDFFIQGKGQREGKDYKKYLPVFVNFHASNAPPIGLFVERFRYGGHTMVDINGKENWEEFFDLPGNEEIKKWFSQHMLFNVFARSAGTVFLGDDDVAHYIISKYIQDGSRIDEANLKERTQDSEKSIREKWNKEGARLAEGWDRKDEKIMNEIFDITYKLWLDATAIRNLRGSIDQEEWAYAIIAKYLEFKKNDPKEPLWNMFFPGESMDDLEKKWTTKERDIKLFDKKRGFVNLMPEVVAMVATRYILGHFDQPPLPEFRKEKELMMSKKENGGKIDSFYAMTPIEKLKKVGVTFTFETPEIIENQREGLQRIIHAKHIYKMAKAFETRFSTNLLKGWFDSEHAIHNGFDPIQEIADCPNDYGKYFLGFHVGAPKPYHPVHEPIDVGSEAQRWIYIYAYKMRQKGFGIGGNKAIIIFERGGRPGSMPGEWMRSSVTAMRLIVDELRRDTPPEKLPPEFYGVSPEGFYSEERQMAIIKEHYWDPLKGMLAVPEEEYTYLGKAAMDKGKKPDEWKKEEFR